MVVVVVGVVVVVVVGGGGGGGAKHKAIWSLFLSNGGPQPTPRKKQRKALSYNKSQTK